MTGQDEGEGFLGRWARRKQEANAEPAVAPKPAIAPQAPNEEDLAAKLATLPKIEDVTAATDIKAFLESWVPDALRNAALRKIWATDPHISTFIETADYQWDWTVPGGAPGSGPLEPGFDAQRFIAEMFENRAGTDRAGVGARDAESQPASSPDLTGPAADRVAAQNGDGVEENTSQSHDRQSADSAKLSVEALAESNDGTTDDHFALQQSATEGTSESTPRRRRHGGALPV